jgi:hypothetical protein
LTRLIRIIAISCRHRDAERAFQSTNGTIVDGDAEKSRNNPYESRDGSTVLGDTGGRLFGIVAGSDRPAPDRNRQWSTPPG